MDQELINKWDLRVNVEDDPDSVLADVRIFSGITECSVYRGKFARGATDESLARAVEEAALEAASRQLQADLKKRLPSVAPFCDIADSDEYIEDLVRTYVSEHSSLPLERDIVLKAKAEALLNARVANDDDEHQEQISEIVDNIRRFPMFDQHPAGGETVETLLSRATDAYTKHLEEWLAEIKEFAKVIKGTKKGS